MVTHVSHPAAELFPLLGGDDLQELADDIKANGLCEPITLLDSQVLDGRNRLRGCGMAGVEPDFVDFDAAWGDPLTWVISKNLKRRHLTTSQRGMLGAKLEAHYAELAKTRTRGKGVANLPPQNESAAASPRESRKARDDAAAVVNVSPKLIQAGKTVLKSAVPELVELVESGEVAVTAAAEVATLPVEQQTAIVDDGNAAIKREARRNRTRKGHKARVGKAHKRRELSDLGTFHVIYADPPWRYDYSESGSREIENQYPTMTQEQLWQLEIDQVAAPDCVFFLWATPPKLDEALELLESWHFDYKTCLVWVKDKIGMGYYARQRHELLLVATRGALPTPLPENRFDSVIEVARGDHSAKPEVVYEMLEAMYPEYDKLELFARTRRPGWEVWGNET